MTSEEKAFIWGLERGIDLLEKTTEDVLRGHRKDTRGDPLRSKIGAILIQIKVIRDYIEERKLES